MQWAPPHHWPPPLGLPPGPPPVLLPLVWQMHPQHIEHSQRILAILGAQQQAGFAHHDILSSLICSQRQELQGAKGAFYQSPGPEQLLNALAADTAGRARLDAWLRHNDYATNLVVDDVSGEMDNLKQVFQMKTSSLQPQHLREFTITESISDVVAELAPTLRRILFGAAQTERAALENIRKSPEVVSTYIVK